MYCSTHGSNDTFRFKNIKLVLAHTEPGCADAPVPIQQGTGDKNSFVITSVFSELVQGIFRCFGYDRFIGFTVDHDLPPPLIYIVPLFVLPDRQSPFFKQVNRRIDMTGNVCHKVVPGNPHEIILDIGYIILQFVPAIFQSQVLVNCG